MAFWYTVRSHKQHSTEVGEPWSNVVEVGSITPMENAPAQNIMAAWRQFERTLALSPIRFTDATMSSWKVEGDESPPDELFQYFGMATSGLRVPSGLAAPLTQTLFISKMPERGQKGKLNFRGCVEQADLLSTTKGYVMVPSAIAVYDEMVTDAWTTLTEELANWGAFVGMVSYPRIGWELVPVLPGQRPKTRPVFSTELYERTVGSVRANGTSHMQLEHH